MKKASVCRHSGFGDRVQVVEDEDDLTVNLGELVEQLREHQLDQDVGGAGALKEGEGSLPMTRHRPCGRLR